MGAAGGWVGALGKGALEVRAREEKEDAPEAGRGCRE